MKFSVILAARLRSTRLPAKALLPLAGLPLLTFMLRRLKGAALVDQIILATTNRPEDRHLATLAYAEGVRVFQGSEDDLIRRTLDACEHFSVEYAVRVTGDCPFVDAASLDHCLAQCTKAGSFDLASTKGAFPVGIDYEVLRAASLATVDASGAPDAADKEHLTKYFYDHGTTSTSCRSSRRTPGPRPRAPSPWTPWTTTCSARPWPTAWAQGHRSKPCSRKRYDRGNPLLQGRRGHPDRKRGPAARE